MAEQDTAPDKEATEKKATDSAVAEGGAYEIIRKRLVEQGKSLYQQSRHLNQERLEEFGSSEMSVNARVRVRTENNCIARDIVQVGDQLLFGYNVFIGLKKETRVEDVFALFKINLREAGAEMEPVPLSGSFLTEPGFASDFEELYRYYKHTKLVELTIKNGKLLAGFQIGERMDDLRVFRWSVSADGTEIKYIDNRGERDIQLPPAYDFDWVQTSREDSVQGRHPHLSILDRVFVETVGGDLTVKIENNTEDGLGIYREPVEDDTQSLDDAQVFYAAVGQLILLKIRPYREEQWRYLVFNCLTDEALRIDAIGESCVQLPEDHGIIFPGGYYLETGEKKTFDTASEGLKFKRRINSPNGEDVLYVFYESEAGAVGLFPYNIIEKRLQNPIYGHGYALAESGQLVNFSAETEPTRVHPMQIWSTPYVSAEFASQAPSSQTFFGRIGNAELVRGVSDLFSLCRMIDNQSVSLRLYEELSKASRKLFDDHYWLGEADLEALGSVLREIAATAELVIDEFEKVESIRQQSARIMQEAQRDQAQLLQSVRPDSWELVADYVDALGKLRHQRGHLITIRELRYIDLANIDELDLELESVEQQLSTSTVEFLSDEKALQPYLDEVARLDSEVEKATTVVELAPMIEVIENTASGLDLLSELMASLKVEDATVRTRIIEAISQVYSALNQCKAKAGHKRKNMGSEEAVAQFGAQFKLFSQSIANALGLASTPEKCDEQLSRLLVQLEELESQFSEFDQFLGDIVAKREEIYESFEAHKQQLLDERQRKAQSITDASERMLSSIEKRSLKFSEADDLNTYFASDALVVKTREMVGHLRDLDSAVKADDIESRFKAIKEQALRSLRDKSDIYEDGGNLIKLGPRHRFSVNTQELDLTIIPRDSKLNLHLIGTNYYEPLESSELQDTRKYWDMNLESETADVYRAEYLASLILDAAQQQREGLNVDLLNQALLDEAELMKMVREFAAPRYKEGYEKGIHDHDAARLLQQIIPALDRADLLKFDPLSRGLAQIFWANIQTEVRAHATESQLTVSVKTWPERAHSALQMQTLLGSRRAVELLAEEMNAGISAFIERHPIPVSELNRRRAADYLVAELGRERVEFIGSKYATRLVEEFRRSTDDNTWRRFQTSLERLKGFPAQRWDLTSAWLNALIERQQLTSLARYIPEAVGLINADERLPRRITEADTEIQVEGLLGDHPRIQNQCLKFALDAFLERMERHRTEVVPGYQNYLRLRHEVAVSEREKLRLEEFKARPLSSFVRNRLINESYLPLIGDNLAKQMGTVGEDKRSDLMGLLMMISPPGYGKTTLMEYVANRLGLIFMKINCPSLGHEVLSLDPEQAPDATSRQELQKLNLSLEMGNNVMLYLDDIQHTNPEFLQKFISLCDGSRRIDGVWRGRTKTYDMRGRKFCVVMAGNPYTESGEAFKIPDMLANRADIYNLGDILGGMDEQFALSYIENALTSNPVLAPLAIRDLADVYKLIDMAKGRDVGSTDLSHQYSAAEVNEILDVLRKMFAIQDVVLKINQQYISSAAQDDNYRTEPSFKLQGSYRNMNKMTEKVTAVMNDAELMQMIEDHYLGEAQLLTTGAEANLLKLAELRGNMTEEQEARWAEIKKDFLRNKAMGGGDVGDRVVAQLVDLVGGVGNLAEAASAPKPDRSFDVHAATDKLVAALENHKPQVKVMRQPASGADQALTVLSDALEQQILPAVAAMHDKLEINRRTFREMKRVSQKLRKLEQELGRESSDSQS